MTEANDENHQPQFNRETDKDDENGYELTLQSVTDSNPEAGNM